MVFYSGSMLISLRYRSSYFPIWYVSLSLLLLLFLLPVSLLRGCVRLNFIRHPWSCLRWANELWLWFQQGLREISNGGNVKWASSSEFVHWVHRERGRGRVEGVVDRSPPWLRRNLHGPGFLGGFFWGSLGYFLVACLELWVGRLWEVVTCRR